MEAIETIQHANCTIRIIPDTDPESPRSWDNLGTMVCWHRRYDLGDKRDYPRDTPAEALRRLAADAVNSDAVRDDETVGDDHINRILEKHYLILPLYLYDHGGLTISTRSFSCPWDSGQVGFIYASIARLREEYGNLDRADLIERGTSCLQSEVAAYDQYLRGEVYGYVVSLDADPDITDSCWGYYGMDDVRAEAKRVAERLSDRETREAAACTACTAV